MNDKRKDKEYVPPTRAEILEYLDVAMGEAMRKIESGRIYDEQKEKVRISWLKCLGYLSNCYASLMKDRDLEELEERIKELERRANNG